MELLKKQKKAAADESVVTPDFSKMNTKELIKYHDASGLEVDDFETMTIKEKREALKAATGGSSVDGDASAVTEKTEAEITSKKAANKVEDEDLLVKTVHEIENISTEKQAHEVAKTLIDEWEFSDFRLGGVLSVIQANGWFGGYDNFK